MGERAQAAVRVKILLDEMHAPRVAALLRDLGHEAVAVKERADLIGLPDEDLLRAATAEGRVIVTENVKDFAVLHRRVAAEGQRHVGLVFTHPRRFPSAGRNHVRVLADALDVFLSKHGSMLSDAESFVWWLERADR
jgi:hypothetical protein